MGLGASRLCEFIRIFPLEVNGEICPIFAEAGRLWFCSVSEQ